MTSTVAKPANGSASALRPYETFMQKIAMTASVTDFDAVEIAKSVVDNISQATSLDDIFAVNTSGPSAMEDHVDKALNVTGVTFHASDAKFSEGGLGFYAVIHGFDDYNPDTQLTITCGATNIVASLYQAVEQLGALDDGATFRFMVKSKQSKNGTLFLFAPAPALPSRK